MTHGSLFSGIGGFDLAASWMGWENKFHCEWNKFGQTVLKHYWPEAQTYEDITKSDFTIWNGRIDILTGGFPCQPYSAAGKRLGKEDDRHLWPEMLRAIREVSPRWVVGENVRGLTNWNGGMVFDEVQADLEAIGYEVLPFLLPACAVDAPHRRDRIWFVAYRTDAGFESMRQKRENPVHGFRLTSDTLCSRHGRQSETTGNDFSEERALDSNSRQNENRVWRETERCSEITSDSTSEGREEREQIGGRSDSEENRTGMDNRPERSSIERVTSDSCNQGLQGGENNGSAGSIGKKSHEQPAGFVRPTWNNFPTEPPVRSRNDGLSAELAGITVSKHRNESIKAYGNAIVPQVAYQIFKAIQQYEQQ